MTTASMRLDNHIITRSPADQPVIRADAAAHTVRPTLELTPRQRLASILQRHGIRRSVA